MLENANLETENTLVQNPVQEQNQALIKMMVLLYQIDGKVTLTEQDYVTEVIEQMEWSSGISKEAYLNESIHLARQAIDTQRSEEFLRELSNELNIDAAKSLDIAMAITNIDGKRSDEELELLSLLSNRILAKGLVA